MNFDDVTSFIYQPEKKKVVLYQMGKVASVTMATTLEKQCPELLVIRSHFTSKKALSYRHKLIDGNKFSNYLTADLMRSCFREQLTRAIFEETRNEVLYLITVIRDPLKQVISSYFSNLHYFFDGAKDEINNQAFRSRVHGYFSHICRLSLSEREPTRRLKRPSWLDAVSVPYKLVRR